MSGDGDGDPPPPCLDNDEWEPNDLPEAPTDLAWENLQEDDASVEITPFLCAGEGDWYLLHAGDLEFELYKSYLNLIVTGSSWCGEGCNQPELPPAPENTVAVEIFDADTLMLVAQSVSAQGRIRLTGSGEAYSHDLLIHVYGPTPAATYEYYFGYNIRGYSGEDECEC